MSLMYQILIAACVPGWSLGEHGEWAKYSNFDVATRVPLIVHAPGVTSPLPWPGGKTFSYVNVFENTQERFDEGYVVRSMVELVDVFPTVASLAGLPSLHSCKFPSFKTDLCTEGSNLAHLLGHHERVANHQAYAFSQYPRPSDTIRDDSDLPSLANITIMGYSARSNDFRFTLWVGFDSSSFCANLSDLHAGELYILSQDPNEDNNIFYEHNHAKPTPPKLAPATQHPWTEILKEYMMYFSRALKTKRIP